jgi:hypothetical protein
MSERNAYLAAAIRLYLDLPGAPPRASRTDWAVAATLHDRGVSLHTLAHALRLATLRRLRPGEPREPVRSLAYYRRVFERLTPDDLDPGYVDYVARRYRDLLTSPAQPLEQSALSDRQNRALSGRR